MVEATFEIRVAGAIPEEDLRDMGAVVLAVDQVNTVIYSIPDQSALYGLLARLRALGIEVVEVRRIPEASPAEPELIPIPPGEEDDENE
ncbi:hypothetical protein ACFPJ1_11355 [Kribbella qitaiheensis]|uniref:hypothetical protein n=1 Tax=Kribbella qitaiheensis TaxID=1544730 RepID=UPI003612807C